MIIIHPYLIIPDNKKKENKKFFKTKEKKTEKEKQVTVRARYYPHILRCKEFKL